jgi:hypothetical protein
MNSNKQELEDLLKGFQGFKGFLGMKDSMTSSKEGRQELKDKEGNHLVTYLRNSKSSFLEEVSKEEVEARKLSNSKLREKI